MGKYADWARERKADISVKEEKATDMDIIVAELIKLPHGQLKKVLTDDVIAVLRKYGYDA